MVVHAVAEADAVRKRPRESAPLARAVILPPEPNRKPSNDRRGKFWSSCPSAHYFGPTPPSGSTRIPCRTEPPPAPESRHGVAAIRGVAPREIWPQQGDRTPSQAPHPPLARTPLYKRPLHRDEPSAELTPSMKTLPPLLACLAALSAATVFGPATNAEPPETATSVTNESPARPTLNLQAIMPFPNVIHGVPGFFGPITPTFMRTIGKPASLLRFLKHGVEILVPICTQTTLTERPEWWSITITFWITL